MADCTPECSNTKQNAAFSSDQHYETVQQYSNPNNMCKRQTCLKRQIEQLISKHKCKDSRLQLNECCFLMSTTVHYFTLQTEPVLNQKANQRGYSIYLRQSSVLGLLLTRPETEAAAELPHVQASLDYTLQISLQFSMERLYKPVRTGKCIHEIFMIQDWHDTTN